MPSPDLSALTELTLYDRTPAELVERALLDAAVKLPTWVPRDGNTEVVLMESLGLEVAELVYAVNRLPGAVLEVLLLLYGIARDPGAPATADATFTLADTDGHEIPVGTELRLSLGPDEALTFTVTAGGVAAPGEATATATITAGENTSSANGTPAGTPLELVSSLFFVDGVELASEVVDGADPEDDATWQARGVQTFQRLTSTLVLPEHFTAEALSSTGVYRATTIDNYDPATGPAPGDNAGHVTVAVLGEGGAVLSPAAKADLEALLESKTLAQLDVHVDDPTITDVDVDVTVRALPGYDEAQVVAAVTAALEAYLSPDTWPWSGSVRRFELVARVDDATGVDYVENLTTPAADVPIAGVAPLARLGAVTVTVTLP